MKEAVDELNCRLEDTEKKSEERRRRREAVVQVTQKQGDAWPLQCSLACPESGSVLVSCTVAGLANHVRQNHGAHMLDRSCGESFSSKGCLCTRGIVP